MTIPVWVLLGFAMWTLFMLAGTVGVYRWSRIFTGRANVAQWQPDVPQGCDWYRRAMRAHANCLENLPVYGALVVVTVAAGIRDPRLDVLAVVLLVARVLQTTVHVALVQTNGVATVRFLLYLVQFICMAGMAWTIVQRV